MELPRKEGRRKSYVQSADDVWLGAVGDRCHVSYMVQNKEREGERERYPTHCSSVIRGQCYLG